MHCDHMTNTPHHRKKIDSVIVSMALSCENEAIQCVEFIISHDVSWPSGDNSGFTIPMHLCEGSLAIT